MRQGLRLALAGVAVGLLAAALLTRLISAMLYSVGAHDLATFVVAPIVFLGIALLASYLPALRAMGIDPMEALRGS